MIQENILLPEEQTIYISQRSKMFFNNIPEEIYWKQYVRAINQFYVLLSEKPDALSSEIIQNHENEVYEQVKRTGVSELYYTHYCMETPNEKWGFNIYNDYKDYKYPVNIEIDEYINEDNKLIKMRTMFMISRDRCNIYPLDASFSVINEKNNAVMIDCTLTSHKENIDIAPQLIEEDSTKPLVNTLKKYYRYPNNKTT